MANQRKTINVAELTNEVNSMLKNSTSTPEGRAGSIAVLEHVLLSTGNYHGYRYLTETEVPAGQKAGIHYVVKSANQYSTHSTTDDASFVNTDDTRREYF